MSLRPCRTRGCPHRTREGYAGNPHMEADGVFCWRCRQKTKRGDEQALRKLKKAKERAARG